jgi:hypothetical protein
MTCNIFNRCRLPSPLELEGPRARRVIEGRKVTPLFWAVLLVRAAIVAACTH